MGLLKNEFIKIKTSKAVKWVVILFLIFIALSGLVLSSEKKDSPVELYGFGAPFIWLFGNGASGFFMYAVIVSGFIASEFESGVIHNALSSGVKRSHYFAAKVTAIFGVSVLIYLIGVSTLCIFKSMSIGFDPAGKMFSDYGLKVLAYTAGALILILAYISVFIFIAYLLREAVLTFVASVAIIIVELLAKINGPLRTAWSTISFIESDNILSWDFARLFIPCACLLVVSLAASYVLFAARDVD